MDFSLLSLFVSAIAVTGGALVAALAYFTVLAFIGD